MHFGYWLYNNVITYFPNHALRQFFVQKLHDVEIGKNTFIHIGCTFSGKVRIGSHTVIGRRCYLGEEITIGDNVAISAESYLFAASHDKDDLFLQEHIFLLLYQITHG